MKSIAHWIGSKAFIALLLLVLISGVGFTIWIVRLAENTIQHVLAQDAQLIAESLDVAQIKALSGSASDLDLYAYQSLKEKLHVLRQTYQQYRFLYLLSQRADGSVVINIDSEPIDSSAYSPPGQVYEEASPKIVAVFRHAQVVVEGPIEDRWGTWVSGLAPILDPKTGKVLAVFGVDRTADNWHEYVLHHALIPFLITFAMSLILGFAFLWIEGGPLYALRKHRWPYFESIIVFCFGLILTIGVSWMVNQANLSTRHRIFNQLAQRSLGYVAEQFSDLVELEIESLSRLYNSSNEVTADEFDYFSSFLIQRDNGILALEWIPLIEGEPNAYPVEFIFPRSGNEAVLGYNLTADPLRKAAYEKALMTAQMTATDPLSHFHFKDDDSVLIVLQSVVNIDPVKNKKGCIAAVVSLRTILGVIENDEHSLIALSLHELNKDSAPRFITATDEKTALFSVLRSTEHTHDNPYYLKPLFFSDRIYAISAYPTQRFFNTYRTWSEWVAFCVGIALTLLLTFWVYELSRRKTELEQCVKQRTSELEEERNRLTATLRSIGDGVISTDEFGIIDGLNAVAERLTGWPVDLARGRPVTEVFNIVNVESRQTVENPIERSLREGIIVGLANHTVLIARDGAEHQIADSCAPIMDAHHVVIGAVLVFRDVTAEYAQREQLRISEELHRLLFENAVNGVALHEMVYDAEGNPSDYRYLHVNPAFERHTGIRAESVIGKTAIEVFGLSEKPPFLDEYVRAIQGERLSFEVYFETLDRYFQINAYRFAEGKFATVFADITERRKNEKLLKDHAQEIDARNAEMTRFLEAATGRELRMVELKKEVNAFAQCMGEPMPYKLDFIIPSDAPSGSGKDT
jgi:PAS domain S-box-containing protein